MKFQRRRLHFIGDICGGIAVLYKLRGSVNNIPLLRPNSDCVVSSNLLSWLLTFFPTFKFCRNYHRERGWNDYVRRRRWKRFYLFIIIFINLIYSRTSCYHSEIVLNRFSSNTYKEAEESVKTWEGTGAHLSPIPTQIFQNGLCIDRWHKQTSLQSSQCLVSVRKSISQCISMQLFILVSVLESP